MRKPATPGPDPDATVDSGTGVRAAGAIDNQRSDRAARKLAVTLSDGSSDEASLNDAWLVERARHGDHQAFAVLVRRYERKLIRVLTRLVREPEQARDLAQETFWRVYTCLDRFDTAQRFGPWLFRIGVNLGLDWLRSSKIEPSLATSIDRTGRDGQSTFDLPDVDPRIQVELAQEVQFILTLMPVSYRTILVLRDLEGFSSSEVAAIVGRREATVRWRLCMARERFREIWERRQQRGRGGARDGISSHENVNGQ
jgi:RNA polymerase sigma-70 factor (ECF subfamily)